MLKEQPLFSPPFLSLRYPSASAVLVPSGLSPSLGNEQRCGWEPRAYWVASLDLILALPLTTGCVNLGKVLNPAEPQLPALWNGYINSTNLRSQGKHAQKAPCHGLAWNHPQYYCYYVIYVIKGSWVSWEAGVGVVGKAFNWGNFEFQLCQLITGYNLGQVTLLLWTPASSSIKQGDGSCYTI